MTGWEEKIPFLLFPHRKEVVTFFQLVRLMDTTMKNSQQPDDEEAIVRQCLSGDTQSYSILVDRYKTMIYNLAYRMVGDEDTAKDLAQECFIAGYSGLAQFRFSSKYSSWIYSIALNKCRDHLRLTKETVSTDEIADILPDRGISPERAVSAGQDKDLLQRALNDLPADYREVLILKHIEELSYEEISVITGLGVSALKVRAHRGREMLRKILEQAGVEHG
jgi:RNA polymerase sigma-70 factor (ECF subfamily)